MTSTDPLTIGWREWISLPELPIKQLFAKVDTGARTSALHAFYVEPVVVEGEDCVRFGVHPRRKTNIPEVHCTAKIFDYRSVRDSGGHEEMRYVIKTPVLMGAETFKVEITLTNRDSMRFRFLLGRNALKGRYLVDAARSSALGRPRRILVGE